MLWMKKLLNVSIFAAVLVLGIALLISRLIDGTAFVAFTVAGCLGATVYALLPSITEFSIGGNSVKFQEKLNEAERITDELKKLKAIAVRTTLNSMKAQQKINFLVHKNLVEFRDVYQMLRDAKEFKNDYQVIVMETVLALRENIFDFVDLEIESPVPHWAEWRDTKIKEYIDTNVNNDLLPLRMKMSIRFAIQYLYLSDFIYGLSIDSNPTLKIVNHDEGWHVIMKDST